MNSWTKSIRATLQGIETEVNIDLSPSAVYALACDRAGAPGAIDELERAVSAHGLDVAMVVEDSLSDTSLICKKIGTAVLNGFAGVVAVIPYADFGGRSNERVVENHVSRLAYLRELLASSPVATFIVLEGLEGIDAARTADIPVISKLVVSKDQVPGQAFAPINDAAVAVWAASVEADMAKLCELCVCKEKEVDHGDGFAV